MHLAEKEKGGRVLLCFRRKLECRKSNTSRRDPEKSKGKGRGRGPSGNGGKRKGESDPIFPYS